MMQQLQQRHYEQQHGSSSGAAHTCACRPACLRMPIASYITITLQHREAGMKSTVSRSVGPAQAFGGSALLPQGASHRMGPSDGCRPENEWQPPSSHPAECLHGMRLSPALSSRPAHEADSSLPQQPATVARPHQQQAARPHLKHTATENSGLPSPCCIAMAVVTEEQSDEWEEGMPPLSKKAPRSHTCGENKGRERAGADIQSSPSVPMLLLENVKCSVASAALGADFGRPSWGVAAPMSQLPCMTRGTAQQAARQASQPAAQRCAGPRSAAPTGRTPVL